MLQDNLTDICNRSCILHVEHPPHNIAERHCTERKAQKNMYFLRKLIGAAMVFVGGRQAADKAPTTLAGRCSCAAPRRGGFCGGRQPRASRS